MYVCVFVAYTTNDGDRITVRNGQMDGYQETETDKNEAIQTFEI